MLITMMWRRYSNRLSYSLSYTEAKAVPSIRELLFIIKIKERNKKVELDKAWETSWTRKLCICVLTYIVVVIYSYVINKISNIWLSSLVPVIGFTLSTLSLNVVRKSWEKRVNNK